MEVNIPETTDDFLLLVECTNCLRKFRNTQGLGVHKLKCKKDNHEIFAPNSNETVEFVVKDTVNYLLRRVEERMEDTDGLARKKAKIAENNTR